jgi:hypothetical protein
MTAPVLIQTLTIQVGTKQWEAQLSNCTLTPNYSDNAVTTFGGEFTTTTEKQVLHLEGFQDYGAVSGLCDLLWEADLTEQLAFTLNVAGATWAGVCSPRKPNAGGAAGSPLDFTIDLPVQGAVTYTPKPTTPLAAKK